MSLGSNLAAAGASAAEIEEWIVARLAPTLEAQPQAIDVEQPLARYGLDSLQFILFVTDLENWLGRKFKENPLHDDSSIRSLAQTLAAVRRPS